MQPWTSFNDILWWISYPSMRFTSLFVIVFFTLSESDKAPHYKPLSWLQRLTVLYFDDSEKRGLSLSRSVYWHQRFEQALSWYMVTWCSLSSKEFNSTKMGSIPRTFPHLTLSEYKNIKMIWNSLSLFTEIWFQNKSCLSYFVTFRHIDWDDSCISIYTVWKWYVAGRIR